MSATLKKAKQIYRKVDGSFKRVSSIWRKVNGTWQLIYSPYAFGGYIKDGLVLQLDCRRYDVETDTYKELVSGGVFPNDSLFEIQPNGTLKLLKDFVGSISSTAYTELCELKDGNFVTSVVLDNKMVAGTIMYSFRVYANVLTDDDSRHNKAKDIENFVPSNAFRINISLLDGSDILI